MRLFYMMLAIALGYTGCATSSPSTSAMQAYECQTPEGWRTIADSARGKILFFSELHGTEEGPEMVGQYACAVAAEGKPVVVALEFSADYNDALQKGLEADDPADIWREGIWDWSRPLEDRDGRTSQAMFALMLQLKKYRDDGLPIDVTFVEVSGVEAEPLIKKYGLNFREHASSRNLKRLQSEYENIIMMTGNLHGSRAEISLGDTTITPAAFLLGDAALSLKMTYDGGTAWNNIGDGGKVNKLKASPGPTTPGIQSFGLDDSFGPRYDGYYHLATATASPPAFIEKEGE